MGNAGVRSRHVGRLGHRALGGLDVLDRENAAACGSLSAAKRPNGLLIGPKRKIAPFGGLRDRGVAVLDGEVRV